VTPVQSRGNQKEATLVEGSPAVLVLPGDANTTPLLPCFPPAGG
jgi:hypothetical protein